MKQNEVYFYGLAANPFTKAHEKIIRDYIMRKGFLVIGITDHDYKKLDIPFDLRKRILEENISDLSGKFIIVKQDTRTYMFMKKLLAENIKVTHLIIGEDEHKDLLNGKWMYADKLNKEYMFDIIKRTDSISSTAVRELFKNIKSELCLKALTADLITEKTFNLLIKEKRQWLDLEFGLTN